MIKKIKFIFIFLFIFLVSCTAESVNSNETFVNVYLEQSDEYKVLSVNPLRLKTGATAQFKVEINEGRFFDGSDDGYFDEENSLFIVPNNYYSRNVSFKTRTEGTVTLNIVNDDNLGSYSLTPHREKYAVGEEVEINITPKDNNKFMCFSYERPYRTTEKRTSSGMAVSFESKYKIKIEKDTTLYTNYFTNELLDIEYVANGGTTIDGKNGFTVDYLFTGGHINPVTILGTYYLFRDGYTLESYNTKADGSGVRVGIGSKVDIEHAENNKIKLYAQWKKWDDPSLFEVENIDDQTVAIVKYIGDKLKDEIVIPNIINNKKVVRIKEQAFDGLNIKSIIFNLDLNSIEKKSIINCNDLKSILFFTNLKSVSKESFDTDSLETIYINSTIYAKDYSTHERDLTAQIDIIRAMKNERVIFIGQSTIRYNHNFKPFKDKYPNKDFYVYGMMAGCNFAVPLDLLTNFLTSNDTVVISILENTIRPNYVGAWTFVFVKHNFDLLQLLNYQQYIDIFFDSYSKFAANEVVNGLYNERFTSEHNGSLDSFGSMTWGQPITNEGNVDSSYIPEFKKYQVNSYYTYLQEIMDRSLVKKENRYITWSTYNKNSITDYSIFDTYESFVRNTLPEFNYLDSIQDNIYPGNYFKENDSIHLSKTGGDVRISRWLEQLPL